jgi:methionyl-tRNA formyltransferase
MLWNSIRALSQNGHQIQLIATCRAAPEYDIRESDFQELATELGAAFLVTQDLNSPESLRVLRAAGGDIAISINWINMIGSEACSTFPRGILNAHAGDLPRYRGNAPVAWAILQGESRIGITIHAMAPDGLDAGPVIMKDYYHLSDQTYIETVFRILEERIPTMFVEALGGLESGSIIPQPQPLDPSLSLRCYPRKPEDGLIHWDRHASDISRLVRASAEPFPGAYTYLHGQRLVVWRARAEQWSFPTLAVPGQAISRNSERGEVGIATGEGVVTLEQVQTAEGPRCQPTALVRSLRDRLGLLSPGI